jgi:alkylated DNA repair dioxygenase AlkB
LSGRYDVEFDSIGMNLYRDGRDRVAWHRDKIPKTIPEPVVALVSLGARRTFALRPLEAPRAGRTLRFDLGEGDLLVTGGRCQRDWEHAVPKTASAGPRISLAFRHGEQPGYDA